MLGRSCFRKALVWSAATLVVVGGLSDPCPSHGSNAHRISHHSSNNEEKVQGFLPEKYNIQGGRHLCKHVAMQIRQVPGDGNCLFHAISACLEYVVNGTHPSLSLKSLTPRSDTLRQMAVDYLSENLDKPLYLEKGNEIKASSLLSTVAAQYNITKETYIEVMRQGGVWGGGPEIVALVNLLKRPVHVYELRSAKGQFCLRRMACFGSPRFDSCETLHILSADSRFPNIKPGRQLTPGNHFLALFPLGRREMRGGDDNSISSLKARQWVRVLTLGIPVMCIKACEHIYVLAEACWDCCVGCFADRMRTNGCYSTGLPRTIQPPFPDSHSDADPSTNF